MLDFAGGKGSAVLFITHDVTEAMRVSDEIVIMAGHPGRVVYRFSPNAAPIERDDPWVLESAARLMRISAVASAFEQHSTHRVAEQ